LRGVSSAAGKKKVGRNALRHGLAAATLRDPDIDAQIKRLAKALVREAMRGPELRFALRRLAAI